MGRFILPAGALTKIDFLGPQYEEKKNIKLDDTPPFFGLPYFLGATNIPLRKSQIEFLRSLKAALQDKFIKEEEILSTQDLIEHITASRIFLAGCLYVINHTTPNAQLLELINKKLGMNKDNYFDDEDKLVCSLAALNFAHSSLDSLDQVNKVLLKRDQKQINIVEWNEFLDFQEKQCQNAKNKMKHHSIFDNYPITSVTSFLTGKAGLYLGATFGALGGDIISNSTHAMPVKYRLTALVSSSLIIISSTGPTGVALLAPVISGEILKTLCTFSFAHILGKMMELVGKMVGIGIGLPLDLGSRLLWNLCGLISDYQRKNNQPVGLTGIRISDGATMINGIEFKWTPEDKIDSSYNHRIEIEPDGRILVNGTLNDSLNLSDCIDPQHILEMEQGVEQITKNLVSSNSGYQVEQSSSMHHH